MPTKGEILALIFFFLVSVVVAFCSKSQVDLDTEKVVKLYVFYSSFVYVTILCYNIAEFSQNVLSWYRTFWLQLSFPPV